MLVIRFMGQLTQVLKPEDIKKLMDISQIKQPPWFILQGGMEGLQELNHHSMAVRTLDNLRATEILRLNGISARCQGDYLMLPQTNDSITAQCVEVLVSQGVGVVRLEERKTNLEEIFLKLTGKEAGL